MSEIKPLDTAILLAAGKGTRLRPITETIPKCLVPINETPLLYIWLKSLFEVGIRHFFINSHYLAHQVEEAIAAHPLKKLVTLEYEEHLLGTAGTVKRLVNKYGLQDESVLVAHADNLCICDWLGFFRSYAMRPEYAVAGLMSFETPTPESCGILELDDDNIVQNFYEKQKIPRGNLANGAVYIFSPWVLAQIQSLSETESDLSTNLIPRLLGKILVWKNDRYLRDIGTVASLTQANIDAQASDFYRI